MERFNTESSKERVIEVCVRATVHNDGVDVDVKSDSDAAEMVTALFLGLMASYDLREDEAKEVFDVMFSKIDEFKNEGE